MTLRADVAAWDGKSKPAIEAVFVRYGGRASFMHDLVELSAEASLQSGATWLLKRALSAGRKLDEHTSAELVGRLPALEVWEAQLHVLQCLPLLRIPAGSRQTAEHFVRACFDSPKTFVRAWAYSGFYELARRFEELRPEAQKLAEAALDATEASVRARMRQTLAKPW
ncbi:MAG: hypothetical protein AAFX58_04280 [Pseudomonadota bacterium]